ncbi:dna cytosine-5--methyltransferase [Trichoderma arundinaceum]|uniref:DNA (cytosine-5-)-methyltransferase n=1 Tax=Trichoderma arundinaceum TaxID=490622 RepID=A0A395NN48_TRIAR|nr:dna cytosine-5--methyltransferase [Trichoderma arundinaceum]
MASHIIIDSMEEDEVEILTSRPVFENRFRSASSVTLGRGSIDEDELEEVFGEEVIDLTGHALEVDTHDVLREGEVSMERYRKPSTGDVFSRGDFIQVRNIQLGTYEIDFVQIRVIAQDGRWGDCKIRGVPFVRTRRLQGQLPKKTNELCMVLHIQRREDGEELPAILVDVPPIFIIGKRTLVITNAAYPEHSCSIGELGAHARGEVTQQRLAELHGELVCRWKFIIYFTMRRQSRETEPEEEVLERIRPDAVPLQQYRVSEETLRNQWRGGRIKGGSWPLDEPRIIDLEEQAFPGDTSSRKRRRRMGQKYTFFDSFSGAGGVSRGAQSSGFKVQFAVDKMSISDFIQDSKDRQMRVDVLHLSPPCQFFSPAHTQESVHDDDNIFALFGCNQLIRKLRPRIITLEQTFGIRFERHRKYLTALIGDYTQFGYSVRWKVVRLCTWGSAQDRKRLIILAAGPGEKLPPFPQPTHSKNGVGGLEPFTTLYRAISSIRVGDDLHNLDSVKRFNPPRAPLDPDKLAGTITTGARDVYHPDGTRELTIRECASIQGFPKSHKFIGTTTSIRRQIGNAFPPNTVEVLYRHIEDWLLEQDGMTRYRPRSHGVGGYNSSSSSSGNSSPQQPSSGAYSSPEMDDVVEIVSPQEQAHRLLYGSSPIIDLT